jgi:hypothetical protein
MARAAAIDTVARNDKDRKIIKRGIVARAPNIDRTMSRARLVCSIIEGKRATPTTKYKITGKQVSAMTIAYDANKVIDSDCEHV